MRVAASALDLIGHTPLVQVAHGDVAGPRILAKLEGMNPGGSVKDRLAVGLLRAALADVGDSGPLRVVEASSGNLGVSLAMCAAVLGLHLTLVMPESVSADHRRLLSGFGAEVVSSPAALGMDGAEALADALRRERGAVALAPFANPRGPEAMATSLAAELAAELEGPAAAVVAGVGTGATLMGLASLKRRWPDLQVVAVEPAESPVLSGGRPGTHHLDGLGSGFVPAILDLARVDRILTVSTAEALDAAREAARRDGILCGPSGGAALAAARRLARSGGLDPAGGPIVTVLPDLGERYLLRPGFIQAPPPRLAGGSS